MTLKEKFGELIKIALNDEGFFYDTDKAEKCEQIADDYAIEYSKWIRSNAFEVVKGWMIEDKFYTDEELLKEFKKQKGYVV